MVCIHCQQIHYNDITMSAMVSQIIGVSIICLTICSGSDQRKCQSSASLAFVRGIHKWPVDFPHHKGPVMRKCFHLMTSSCLNTEMRQAVEILPHRQKGVAHPNTVNSVVTDDLAMWRARALGATLLTRGPFYWYGLTTIPAWINNYIHFEVWDKITYPFLNFNGATIEV